MCASSPLSPRSAEKSARFAMDKLIFSSGLAQTSSTTSLSVGQAWKQELGENGYWFSNFVLSLFLFLNDIQTISECHWNIIGILGC